MMNRGGSSDSIPTDLVLEILSRLPQNSIARFRCVSKLWSELFLTRSWARPRLLFLVNRNRELSFYSSPQPQNPYEKSSLVVAAEFHTKLSLADDMWLEFRGLTSGLFYFPNLPISKKGDQAVPVIFNPNTGLYASLPKLTRYRKSLSFLGFDPVDKQFKVLSMAYPSCGYDHQILTVGTGVMRWRKIQCPLNHVTYCKGICINGVLYYSAKESDQKCVIVCFDVRSEEFKFIDREFAYHRSPKLINYNGKLGAASLGSAGNKCELCLWVLEDVEKQEWSKCVYTLPENTFVDICNDFIDGMTATGEIVFSLGNTYVFYFNPEKNTLQRVEIQGLENGSRVYAFVDYVEDLNVNDPKQLKSSISAPSVKNKRSLDIITKRPKSQHTEEIIETDRDRDRSLE